MLDNRFLKCLLPLRRPALLPYPYAPHSKVQIFTILYCQDNIPVILMKFTRIVIVFLYGYVLWIYKWKVSKCFSLQVEWDTDCVEKCMSLIHYKIHFTQLLVLSTPQKDAHISGWVSVPLRLSFNYFIRNTFLKLSCNI